jgi:hypothetical protein
MANKTTPAAAVGGAAPGQAANQTGAMANKTTPAATTTTGGGGAAPGQATNQTENKKVDTSDGIEEFFQGLFGAK